jgi:SP family facilitated glucose transporter-like MFS transporter 1
MTILSVFLIDRLGRRPLFLTSQIMMIVFASLLIVARYYNIPALMLTSILLFVASFAIGLGPIPWLLIPELFTTCALTSATSISVFVNWLSAFVVSFVFPSMDNAVGAFVFAPFVAISAVLALFMFWMLHETTGKDADHHHQRHQKEDTVDVN